ncbi:MAG: hypothetical protein LBI10_06395 [Deltaproteobacteria bacterium]|jgi:hypothetical protein|nr:hypothetical protein [Deltaproteobacteria bacterium]
MSEILGPLNGQNPYNPASQSRKAWRDEMLNNFLDQMRERQSKSPALAPERTNDPPKITKGAYVNVYV